MQELEELILFQRYGLSGYSVDDEEREEN